MKKHKHTLIKTSFIGVKIALVAFFYNNVWLSHDRDYKNNISLGNKQKKTFGS